MTKMNFKIILLGLSYLIAALAARSTGKVEEVQEAVEDHKMEEEAADEAASISSLPYTCDFKMGDSITSTYEEVDADSDEECIRACIKRKGDDLPGINGLSIGLTKSEKGCFCSMGMTGIDKDPEYKACFLRAKEGMCTKKDASTCKSKAKNAKDYCEISYIKEQCPEMCGICSSSPVPEVPNLSLKEITSGNCAAHTAEPLTEAECKRAPIKKDPSYTYVKSGSWEGYPSGCYVYSTGKVYFNKIGTDCSKKTISCVCKTNTPQPKAKVDPCVTEATAITHVVRKKLGPKPSMTKCATACDTWGRNGDEAESNFARCTSWSFSPRDLDCYLKFVTRGKLFEGSNGCGGIKWLACPKSHPYAFNFGRSCCAEDKDNTHGALKNEDQELECGRHDIFDNYDEYGDASAGQTIRENLQKCCTDRIACPNIGPKQRCADGIGGLSAEEAYTEDGYRIKYKASYGTYGTYGTQG